MVHSLSMTQTFWGLCPSQIVPPTEKPTPIKSPTIQLLDYGEAVALYNFNADLPVELSFRKVSLKSAAGDGLSRCCIQ